MKGNKPEYRGTLKKVPSGKDLDRLYDKITKMITDEFGTTEDGDSPISVSLVDRTKFEPLHFFPIPYEHLAITEKLRDQRLRALLSNLKMATERLSTFLDIKQISEKPGKPKDETPLSMPLAEPGHTFIRFDHEIDQERAIATHFPEHEYAAELINNEAGEPVGWLVSPRKLAPAPAKAAIATSRFLEEQVELEVLLGFRPYWKARTEEGVGIWILPPQIEDHKTACDKMIEHGYQLTVWRTMRGLVVDGWGKPAAQEKARTKKR